MPFSSIAVALLFYDDSLKLALEQNTGNDLLEQCIKDDAGRTNKANLAKKITRLYDPATGARCKEALCVRKGLEEMGVFATAAMLSQSEKLHDSMPSMLTNILGSSKSREIMVDAIGGLNGSEF
mmetsp:Transcript_22323/g.34230  ORF Transcript_22323/g.34230 Transcript_22323/m.34230 type:complete len:124 (+) Transcript_22323:617-988(+)